MHKYTYYAQYNTMHKYTYYSQYTYYAQYSRTIIEATARTFWARLTLCPRVTCMHSQSPLTLRTLTTLAPFELVLRRAPGLVLGSWWRTGCVCVLVLVLVVVCVCVGVSVSVVGDRLNNTPMHSRPITTDTTTTNEACIGEKKTKGKKKAMHTIRICAIF